MTDTTGDFDAERLAKRATLRQDQQEPYAYERTHVLGALLASEGRLLISAHQFNQ